MIRRCGDHGFVEGDACPYCGDAGQPVLSEDRRIRLSKFLSEALRHSPDDAGIELDDRGWTRFEDLVAAADRRFEWADRAAVAAVVATDRKGRFERDEPGDAAKAGDPVEAGDWVRASYGHSVAVDLESTDDPVPDRLYHGTAPGNLDSIRRAGLRPVGRQRVHLSASVGDAREVGRRHADDPAILVIDADRLQDVGHEVNRRGDGIYTTDRVPPEHLAVLYGGEDAGSLLETATGVDRDEG